MVCFGLVCSTAGSTACGAGKEFDPGGGMSRTLSSRLQAAILSVSLFNGLTSASAQTSALLWESSSHST